MKRFWSREEWRDYVTFIYEREVFPDQIVDVQNEGCVIKSIVKSGFRWRWPRDEDVLLYLFADVKSKIVPPHIKKGMHFVYHNLIS